MKEAKASNFFYPSLSQLVYSCQFIKEKQRLPCMMILDLNMPKLNGRQALTQVKSDPAFGTLLW